MKISGETYDKMKTAIKLIIDHFGMEKVLSFKSEYLSDTRYPHTETGYYWSLWNRASDDLRHDNNHPRFKFHTRYVPFDPLFNLYADETIKDSHIETAIKKICKELGI